MESTLKKATDDTPVDLETPDSYLPPPPDSSAKTDPTTVDLESATVGALAPYCIHYSLTENWNSAFSEYIRDTLGGTDVISYVRFILYAFIMRLLSIKS